MMVSTDELHPVVCEVLRAKAGYCLGFEDGNWYDSQMAYAYSRSVADIDCLGHGLDIVEFGCFTGIVSASLKRLGHHVVASDVEFVTTDIQNAAFFSSEDLEVVPHDLSVLPLPFPSEAFDMIVFTEILEHLNFNPLPLLREFYRILRPGGLVYCATPNLASLVNRLSMLRGVSYINPVEHLHWNLEPNTGMSVGLHWREWTKSELIELFSGCGFKLNRHCYCKLSNKKSGFPRRQLVAMTYSIFPSLLPGQVTVFGKA